MSPNHREDRKMTTLTKAINEMTLALEMTTIELFESINMHNLLEEHDKIETEDEIRKHLVEIAFNSRMTSSGKGIYSKVCQINDNYFKFKLAA